MRPDYKSWIPVNFIIIPLLSTIILFGVLLYLCTGAVLSGAYLYWAAGICSILCFLSGAVLIWSVLSRRAFSYHGGRQLMKRIVEGIAAYIQIPAGGTCLDVGCGSGALTVACAKKNPQARLVGVDVWDWQYGGSFSQALCEQNAHAEGTDNIRFQQGDARNLPFPDETFDVVVSNYVYHNIFGANKQDLLKETLRVLKKGGTFAIHDLMSKHCYGDMEQFMEDLRRTGYEHVEIRHTADGLFMKRREAMLLQLSSSALLTGKK